MAYDFHITRADDWIQARSAPISRAEWFAFVASEPSLKIDPESWDGSDDESGQGHAVVWDGTEGEQIVFWYDADGEITCRPQTAKEMAVVVGFARRLTARVFGDDGEEYGDDGEPLAAS